MNLFTSSRARAFRECSRLHKYLYIDGFRPVRESEALRFGSLIHRGLEAYWKALAAYQKDSTIIDPPMLDAALAAVAKRGTDWAEQVRAEEMLRGYSLRWATTDLFDFDVLAVETKFGAPLLNPETTGASTTWRLAGKIDCVVRRRSDGRVLVVEHKSSGDDFGDDAADYWMRLGMDHQCSFYVLGAESLGYGVDEILYDVLGKPKQRPLLATPMDARKHKADGTLYANQRALDETPDEYRVRVRAVIEAEPERWFARKSIPRTASQISDFLWDAWQQAAVMRESQRTNRAPRNPDACLRFGRCPFLSVCSANSDPAEYPADFVRLDDVHPELKEEAHG